MLSKSAQQNASFVFGLVFLSLLLGIAIFCPSPTPFQYTVFRIVLSLAAAGAAAMFPGFIQVQVGNAVRAGGAIAVFAVVYFFAPAALPPTHATLSNEYHKYVGRVHDSNQDEIKEIVDKVPADEKEAFVRFAKQLDSQKAALEESVKAGEQMAAATHRKEYNDKLDEIEKAAASLPKNPIVGGGLKRVQNDP